MKMKCEDVRLQLSAFQDDELEDDVRTRIAAHVEECGGCRRELEQLKQAVAQVARLPEVEPADNFTAAVMARLRAQEKRRWWTLPALVYPVIFILFFALGWWFNMTLKRPAPVKAKPEMLAQFLYQSQNLSLSAVQDASLRQILGQR
jgi:anti-sigma factor RsiW